jgi:hypothetical protein
VVHSNTLSLRSSLREKRRLRVFENRVLWGIFGPNRDDVTWSGENFIMMSFVSVFLTHDCAVIKSRRMRWAGHVSRMGRKEVCTGILWESLRERVHLVDQNLNTRIIKR